MRMIDDDGPELTLEADGFHDSPGRRVCFRGINIASNAKRPPFLPFEEERWWDHLASWGFNMVRLTLFWEAIEPEPDCFDRKYLSQVKEMVDRAAMHGIYVLLDMHQDLYSRHLCGDGAPAWTFPKEVNPEKNDGFGGQFWGTAYFLSRDIRACFTHFFKSKRLREHYRNAWIEVAEAAGDSPYILGYDIMNEPSCGDIQNFTGDFENLYLKTMYREVIEAVREVRPGAVGFIEPHALDTYTSKLGPFGVDRLVYAPHLYNPLSVTLRIDPLPEDMVFGAMIELHKMKARSLKMPLFIGEFGAPWTMKPSYARNMAVNDALEKIEREFIDSAYWDYSVRDVDIWNEEDFSIIDGKGNPRGLGVNVRPYVQRISGLPVTQSFDPARKVFFAEFKSGPGMPPTSIHLPEKVQYPEGFQVSVSDGSIQYRAAKGELLYFPGPKARHRVTVRPARPP